MITTIARVIDSNSTDTLIELEGTACGSCSKPCHKQVQTFVPGKFSSEVRLSLKLSDQILLLTHSLFMPLIGFLAAAVVANLLGFNEPVVIMSAILGLMVGLLSCKVQTFSRLQILEENSHEKI